MAATHHLNLEQTGNVQLPMFMRATDLRESITATVDNSFDDPDTVMEDKLAASKRTRGRGSGVYKDVAAHGVINPVQVIHAMHNNVMLGQGGHRTAAADDIMRKTGKDVWVPVIHTDARESSDTPVSIYSSAEDKKAAVRDHRRAMEDSPALGHDIMWQQRHDKPQRKSR